MQELTQCLLRHSLSISASCFLWTTGFPGRDASKSSSARTSPTYIICFELGQKVFSPVRIQVHRIDSLAVPIVARRHCGGLTPLGPLHKMSGSRRVMVICMSSHTYTDIHWQCMRTCVAIYIRDRRQFKHQRYIILELEACEAALSGGGFASTIP